MSLKMKIMNYQVQSRQKGTIKSFTITHANEGAQVLIDMPANENNNTVTTIKHCLNDGMVALVGVDGVYSYNHLKNLVIEYHQLDEDFDVPVSTHYLPLEYSQWSTAVTNHHVDTKRVVEFEIVSKSVGAAEVEMGKVLSYKSDRCESYYSNLFDAVITVNDN
jgi:hypothetical protein